MVLFYIFLRLLVVIGLIAIAVYFFYRHKHYQVLEDSFLAEIMDSTNLGSIEIEYNRLMEIYNNPAKRAFVLKHREAGIKSVIQDGFDVKDTSGKIGGTRFIFYKPETDGTDTSSRQSTEKLNKTDSSSNSAE